MSSIGTRVTRPSRRRARRAIAISAGEMSRVWIWLKALLFVSSIGLVPAAHAQNDAFRARAEALYRAGRYQEALPFAQRSVELTVARYGTNHPATMSACAWIGAIYYGVGQYAESEKFLKIALKINERKCGPVHPEAAQSLNNLAVTYSAQGRYAEVQNLFERALVRERTLGVNHPLVGESLSKLADTFTDQSRYAEAEPLLKRALAILERSRDNQAKVGSLHPNGHPAVAVALNNLGVLYAYQGRYDDAWLSLLRSPTERAHIRHTPRSGRRLPWWAPVGTEKANAAAPASAVAGRGF